MDTIVLEFYRARCIWQCLNCIAFRMLFRVVNCSGLIWVYMTKIKDPKKAAVV